MKQKIATLHKNRGARYIAGIIGKNADVTSLYASKSYYKIGDEAKIYQNLAKSLKGQTAKIYGISIEKLDSANSHFKELFNTYNEIGTLGSDQLIERISTELDLKSGNKNVLNQTSFLKGERKKLDNILKDIKRNLKNNIGKTNKDIKVIIGAPQKTTKKFKDAMNQKQKKVDDFLSQHRSIIIQYIGEYGELLGLLRMIENEKKIDKIFEGKTIGSKLTGKDISESISGEGNFTSNADIIQTKINAKGEEVTIGTSIKYTLVGSKKITVGQVSLHRFESQDIREAVIDLVNYILSNSSAAGFSSKAKTFAAASIIDISLLGLYNRPLQIIKVDQTKKSYTIKFMYEVLEDLSKNPSLATIDKYSYIYEVLTGGNNYKQKILNGYKSEEKINSPLSIKTGATYYNNYTSKSLSDFKRIHNFILKVKLAGVL